MSQHKQPISINPNSLKIQLAYQFLHNLNNLNTKRSTLSNPTHHRSHRVKIAAYASMASVVGSRRAWSRAILQKIRTKKRVVVKTTVHAHNYHLHAGSKRKRIGKKLPNPKREDDLEFLDPFGNSGQELKLRKLVPGVEKMDACDLLDETADFIKCLATQVEVMRNLVDHYSTI